MQWLPVGVMGLKALGWLSVGARGSEGLGVGLIGSKDLEVVFCRGEGV